MKTFLPAILAACAAFFTLHDSAAQAQSSGTTADGLVWSTNGSSVIITGYTGPGGAVSIPSEINGLPVTVIGDSALSGSTSLTSVTIPTSVTNIGRKAFSACSSLASVTLPDSVTSIGNGAFQHCSSLTSVTIPKLVTSIGFETFAHCSGLTSVTFPDGISLTTIGTNAFSSCSKLPSVTIPNGVTSIGNGAFEGCSDLTSVTIPNSVTSIGNGAFEFCSSLASVAIPNGVTSIGEKTFQYCSDLTSVTIPNSVTSIGVTAFNGCSSLTSVTIPNGVTSIEPYSFMLCSSLTSVTIPDSVTSIGREAFSSCSSLTSVTIPNGVTSIGNSAFLYCSSLTSVTIPNGVTSIEFNTFSHCSGLTSVTIPNSVTSIGSNAFSWCSSLTSVTLPESVTSIASDAFAQCSSLTNATFRGIAPTMGAQVFENAASGFTVGYYGDATGFTTPNWTDSAGDTYPAVNLGDLPHLVTPSAGANGSISPNAAQSVTNGGSISFTATPDSGYAVDQWLVNGTVKQTGGTSYTLSNVTADTTVQVTFKRIRVVTTLAASAVTFNGATLQGTINPNGLETTAYFEYGLTTAYGTLTANQNIGSGTSVVPVQATIGSLSSNTVYHFRLVATGNDETAFGLDRTFTTLDDRRVVGSWAERTVVRNLAAAGSAVDIGTLTFTGGTGSIEALVNASGPGWTVAKRYVIPIRNNLGNGSPPATWLKVLPTHETGLSGVKDFELDINVTNATVLLRLRTTGSNGNGASARIAMKTTGLQTFVNSAATAAVTAPAETVVANAVDELNGKAGIGVAPAGSAVLDVNGGDTRGLRLRTRSTLGAPTTGTWHKGTMILDSAANLFICTAAGTPGTWLKVGN